MTAELRRVKRPNKRPKGPKKPKPRKATTGIRSLTIGGCLFALGGLMAILKPVSFYLIGGSSSQWKDANLSEDGSRGFGWFFLALSVFLFASAWQLRRP